MLVVEEKLTMPSFSSLADLGLAWKKIWKIWKIFGKFGKYVWKIWKI